MKKKTIEKIPYLTAEKCSQKKMKYVAAVAKKVIDHKQHLFLEIYENKKKGLNIPVIRCIYTKSEWANYKPDDKTWSSCGIGGDKWYDRTEIGNSETYISEADFKKIERFTKKKAWNKEHWWGCLELLQDNINQERLRKRNEKRQERLQERCAAVGELPEDFEDWYKNELFAKENHIYYKRKGRYVTCWCSHCGKSYTYATEPLDTFEGQFETVITTPKRGAMTRCMECDTQGTYKTAGTMKNVYGITKMCYVGQQYKESGMVSRYIQVEKILSIGMPERFIVTEIARSFFEKGVSRIKDYQLYNGWTGKNEWCDHNIGGLGAQIHEDAGYIYPGTYDVIKLTDFKYCALQEYMKEYDTVEFAEYLEWYTSCKSLEMLVKLGMHKIVTEALGSVWIRNRYIENAEATSVEDVFGINSEHKKLFLRSEGDTALLDVLRAEKDLNATWTNGQCEKLSVIRPDKQKLRLALQYMTIHKFLNRVEKYAGVELGQGMCDHATGCAVHAATTYLDYLSMRSQCGYDMTNTIYLYPRDLEAAHQNMVMESQKAEIDKRKVEVEQKYPDIRRRYRSLRKKYLFEDDNMVIRPAKSAEEIVTEGRILHHCVGSDSYLRKHNRGESTILFLRFKSTCNTPYITVEIKDNRIIQWYGAYDKKPDKENMQQWLNAYVTQLRQKEQQETVAVQIPVQVAG